MLGTYVLLKRKDLPRCHPRTMASLSAWEKKRNRRVLKNVKSATAATAASTDGLIAAAFLNLLPAAAVMSFVAAQHNRRGHLNPRPLHQVRHPTDHKLEYIHFSAAPDIEDMAEDGLA